MRVIRLSLKKSNIFFLYKTRDFLYTKQRRKTYCTGLRCCCLILKNHIQQYFKIILIKGLVEKIIGSVNNC